MPVKQFEMSTIEARRYSKVGEAIKNVRIDHNSSVTVITEMNDKEANIGFRFTANYTSIGMIKVEGSLVFEGDASALASQWASEHKMPDDVANQIHGVIMQNCIPVAVLLARDVRLPPPIPMPQVKVGGPPKAQPSSGIEVA